MSRRTPRKAGRPTSLTPHVHETIVTLISQGNWLATAGEAAGVNRTSVYNWLRRGEAAADLRAAATPVPTSEVAFLRFFDDLVRARAEAETRLRDTIGSAIAGGFVVAEKPVVDHKGNIVLDPATGEILMERRYAPPDGRLALEVLARVSPDRWARTSERSLEVGGVDPDGDLAGVGGVETPASRLHARLRELTAGAGDLPGEGRVIAGVVERAS